MLELAGGPPAADAGSERGCVNLFQFTRALRELGVTVDDTMANLLFMAFDRNYDGLLDSDDLVELCRSDVPGGGGGANDSGVGAVAGDEVTMLDMGARRRPGAAGKRLPPRASGAVRRGRGEGTVRGGLGPTANAIQQILLRRQAAGSVGTNMECSGSERPRGRIGGAVRAESVSREEEERPMSALTAAGGFDPAGLAGNQVYQRASTPLLQLREGRSFAAAPGVAASTSTAAAAALPARPASTPPVVQGSGWRTAPGGLVSRMPATSGPMDAQRSGTGVGGRDRPVPAGRHLFTARCVFRSTLLILFFSECDCHESLPTNRYGLASCFR